MADRVVRRHLLRLALLAGAAAPLAAHAQEAPPAEAESNANDIIVTAQRRAERLEDVPVSITAVTAATIQSAGIKRIDDIQQVASGVQINKGGAFTQPAVRGISTLTLGYGFENNVAVYVDGFYQTDMVTINQDLGTVQSLQVLKGPQGTLYGRNATGGAIVIDTMAPSDRLTGAVTASYGRFDDKRVQAFLSGPLAEGVSFSAAVSVRDSDGYVTDIGDDPLSKDDDRKINPLKNTSIRTKLLLEPTETLDITLAYNHGFVRDDRGLTYTIHDYYPAFAIPATCPNPSPACAGQPNNRATERDTASINDVDASAKADEWTAKLVLDTDIGTLSSYTGYAKRSSHSVFDFDGSKAGITLAQNRKIYNDTFQQTFDFAIDAIDDIDLIVGAFFYNDKLRTPTSGGYTGNPPVLQTQYSVTLNTDAMAYYVDGTWHATDSLFITAGGRYSTERRQLRYNFNFPTVTPEVKRHADFDAFTPRAVIRYEFAPRTNVYASWSKGFRSGVFNPVATANPAFALPVQPEKITAYELGFKTASSTLRFDTAGWYYDFKDLQVGVSTPDPTDPAGIRLIQTIGNAKKARSYGIEAQVQYTPLPDLNIRAGGAWIHARYIDFRNAIGTELNAAAGVNLTGRVQDWSGKQMARAPNWSGNIGFDYGMDLADGRLNLAANGSVTASYVVQNPSLYGASAGAALAGKQRYRQPSYAIFNAQINWTDPSEHFTIGIYGENLTDQRYAITRSGGTFGDYSQYNEPLNYGVRAGVKF